MRLKISKNEGSGCGGEIAISPSAGEQGECDGSGQRRDEDGEVRTHFAFLFLLFANVLLLFSQSTTELEGEGESPFYVHIV